MKGYFTRTRDGPLPLTFPILPKSAATGYTNVFVGEAIGRPRLSDESEILALCKYQEVQQLHPNFH